MAKMFPVLRAKNECLAMVKYGLMKADGEEILWIDGRWPLDEFDELVAFVNEHRKPVEPTRAPEDFIREADEAKNV